MRPRWPTALWAARCARVGGGCPNPNPNPKPSPNPDPNPDPNRSDRSSAKRACRGCTLVGCRRFNPNPNPSQLTLTPTLAS
eukprot:scaffold51798_cov45-Phaeocystis_antarctica.AAC.2